MNDNDELDDLTVLRQEQEAQARRLERYGPPNVEDYADEIDNPRYWQDMAAYEEAEARRRGFADAAAMGKHEEQQRERRDREQDERRAAWAARWRSGQVSRNDVELYGARLRNIQAHRHSDVSYRRQTLEEDAAGFGLRDLTEYVAVLNAHEERYGLSRTTVERHYLPARDEDKEGD